MTQLNKKHPIFVFLKEHSKDASKHQSHLNLDGGKFNLPDEKLREFYKLYVDAIKTEKLSLVEKVSDCFAYFQDIDSKEETVTDDDIVNLIGMTKEMVRKWFEVDEIEVTVSKRKANYHIIYNNLLVKSETAIMFTKELKKEMTDKNNETSKYIDMSVYKTGLRMVGSYKGTKNDNGSEGVYRLYDIYTKDYKDIMSLDMFCKTTIRRPKDTVPTKVKVETPEEVTPSYTNGNVTQYVIIELRQLMQSMQEQNDSLKHFNLNPVKAKYTSSKSGMCYYIETENSFCPFKQREHSRISNPMYVELNRKGMVIRCYDADCSKEMYPLERIGLPSEEDISTKFPIIYKTLFIKQWTDDVNIDAKTQEVLEQGLSCTHYRLAKVLFHLFKDTFRVDDPKQSDWYEFDGVRWKKSFQMYLNVSEIIPTYYRTLKTLLSSISEETDASKSFNSCIGNVVGKLENVSFKNNLLQDAKYMFLSHDRDFAKKLDSNPMLIGFDNGVYDLESMEFRNGRQDDYITYSTGYDYIEYDEQNESTREIYSFLEKIITNHAVREYTLKVLGKSLMGLADEKFYIWTGLSGANGKSTLVNFLEMTLGDYAGAQDVSLLTNKRPNSNAATPEVVEMKGKRMIFFQEPENQDKLRTGILKQYTGGDTIKARELFKAPISFKCQASFVMCCNDLPPVTSLDGGTWRRIRVTEFKSRFCDNPTKANEFKIDHSLKFKLKRWKPYFMSILIEHYKRFVKEGLVEPAEVCEATIKYKTDNDKYNDYFEEYLEEDNKSFVSNSQLYDTFKDWWLNNYSYNSLPNIEDFRKAMRKKYGEEQIVNKQKGFKVNVKYEQAFVSDRDDLE